MSLFSRLVTLIKPLKGYDLNRFYIVRNSLNLFLRTFKPSYIKLGRDRLLLDRDDSLRLSILGTYEPFTTKLLKEKIHKGDIVLDIGAHIGYFTLIAAQKVGKKGKVYAFEPEPNNFAILSKNIKENNYMNVELVNKAVVKTSHKVKLYLNPINAGNHSTVGNSGRKTILAEGISLDDFFIDKYPKTSLIKIDIEGGEYSAIEGMSNILMKNKHLALFTEFWPHGLNNAKKSAGDYIKLLHAYGFRLFIINEDQNRLEPFTKSLLQDYLKHPNKHGNLLGLRG